MSNIVIFHSLNGDTTQMWGKDLTEKFSSKTEVLMPNYPIRADSSYEKFEEITLPLLESGKLNENTIVVAHSIGNAYFIRFCATHKYSPKHYFAVAPGAIYEYPTTRTDYIVKVKQQAYLRKDELNFVKKHFNKVTCLFSDEDDGNTEKFTRFIDDTGATAMYLKGYNHFDGYHRIYKIPELYELIEKEL